MGGVSGLLRRSGLSQPRIAIEIDGIQARVLAARDGMGILGAFLPSYTLESDLQPLTVLPAHVFSSVGWFWDRHCVPGGSRRC